jgi:hypothetical protein
MNTNFYTEMEESIMDCFLFNETLFSRGFSSVFTIGLENKEFKHILNLDNDAEMGQKEIFFFEDFFLTYSDLGRDNGCVLYSFNLEGKLLWKNNLKFYPYKRCFVRIGDIIYILGVLIEEGKFGLLLVSSANGEVNQKKEFNKFYNNIFFTSEKLFIAGSDSVIQVDTESAATLKEFQYSNIEFHGASSNSILLSRINMNINLIEFIYLNTSLEEIKKCENKIYSNRLRAQYLPKSNSVITSYGPDTGIHLVDPDKSENWSLISKDYFGYKFLVYNNIIICKARTKSNEDIVIFIDLALKKITGQLEFEVFIEDIFLANDQLILTGLSEVEFFDMNDYKPSL